MTLYIDNSTLSAYAACQTRAAMRYHLGYTTREESQYLQCGTAVHAAMEVHLKGGHIADALLAFEHAYSPFSDRESPTEAYAIENVYCVLQQWLETHQLDQLPYYVDPALVEIGFAQPLDEHGDIVLVGRLDALVEDKRSGALYVQDTKTTGQVSSNYIRHYQMDSQMSGYIWGVSQQYGRDVVGALINVIEIKKLPELRYKKDGSPYSCPTHKVGVDECRMQHCKSDLFSAMRTPKQLEQWRTTALRLARGFRFDMFVMDQMQTWDGKMDAVDMQGMFNRSCDHCEFRDFCSMGRQAQHVDLLMKYSPWEPYPREAV